MKNFSGINIKGVNPDLDWQRITEVMCQDGSRFTKGNVISSGAVRWTPQEDGWLICHAWVEVVQNAMLSMLEPTHSL